MTADRLPLSALTAAAPRDATILVVDDEPANVALLEQLLAMAGYTRVHSLSGGAGVERRYLDPETRPDLLLLDLHMPEPDGFAVLASLQRLRRPDEFWPVLVLTADISEEARQRSLAGGAQDFLTKPFNATEVLLRVSNLLATHSLHLRLNRQNLLLETRVRERTAELEAASSDLLDRLAVAAEYRDDVTSKHALRVGTLTRQLAEALAMPAGEVDLIGRVAPLHDIGKLGIPDRILLKPGPLTEEEYREIQQHTLIGERILGGGRSPLVQLAAVVARTHHERWDGRGYPDGLRGAAIPLPSRVIAVADVFDALTHARPYKAAWPVDRALSEIRLQRGAAFDPDVVDAFFALIEQHPPAAD